MMSVRFRHAGRDRPRRARGPARRAWEEALALFEASARTKTRRRSTHWSRAALDEMTRGGHHRRCLTAAELAHRT